MKRLVLVGLAAAAFGTLAIAQEDRVLQFPTDYSSEFTFYYSGDRVFNEDQTIRIYANPAVLEAARSGGSLPSGSVLVAELYAALTDAEGKIVESALGRRLPGELKAIAVMERRDGWGDQYGADLSVGDWEFELFSPSGENLGKDTSACRSCHQPLDDSEFVFSLEHLRAAQ